MSSKVSIIVPIYNVEAYLEKCLNSIQKQTYNNLEVLLINDGSPDNSAQICETFIAEDDRFRLITKENGGLSSARNTGLDCATGEYVCFVDSDDWICEDFVEQLVNCVDDKTDVVISKYILDDRCFGKEYVPFQDNTVDMAFEGEEKRKQIVEKHIGIDSGTKYLIKGSIMPVWKNLYRREMIECNNLRFISEREVYSEDYLFNLQAYILAKKIYVSSATAYVHLIVRGSLSQGYRKNMLQMGIQRYQYEDRILEQYYGKEYTLLARQKLPSMLAHASLKLCRCKFKTAVSNLKELIAHPFTTDVFREYKKGKMAVRYKLLYFFLRHKCIYTCVMLARLMCAGENWYRIAVRIIEK